MERVCNLKFTEQVCLDQAKLDDLYGQLGETAADALVCRAMEELALRLAHVDGLFASGEYDALRKCIRSVSAISAQIGMHTLAGVALDTVDCMSREDRNGFAATYARLMRVGDQSLNEYWELQNLSV